MLNKVVLFCAFFGIASASTIAECATAYSTASTAAGGDMSKMCDAVKAYKACLSGIPSSSMEYQSAQAAVAALASTESSVCGGGVVTQAASGVAACSAAYSTASSAAGGDMSKMCVAVKAYKTCLSAIPSSSVEYQSAQAAVAALASTESSVCGGGVVTQAASGISACSAAYSSASSAAGGDMSKMCAAVKAYKTCLSAIPSSSMEYQSAQAAVAALASTESSVCGGGVVTQPASGFSACAAAYSSASSAAGGDMSKMCVAVKAYKTCLSAIRSSSMEYQSAQAAIAALASTESSVCGSDPVTGVAACSATYSTASSASGGDMSKMCVAVKAYKTCLSAIPSSSMEYQSAQAAVTALASTESSVCGGSSGGSSGGDSSPFQMCAATFAAASEAARGNFAALCRALQPFKACLRRIPSSSAEYAAARAALVDIAQKEPQVCRGAAAARIALYKVKAKFTFPRLTKATFTAALQQAAKEAIAARLGISASQIITTSIRDGSVIWETAINDVSQNEVAAVESNIQSVTFNSQQLAGATVATSVQQTSSGASSLNDTPSGVIAGGVVGGFVIIAIVVALAYFSSRSSSKPYGRMQDVGDDAVYASSYTSMEDGQESYS